MLPDAHIPEQFRARLAERIDRWCHRAEDAHSQQLKDWVAANPESAQHLSTLWLSSDFVLSAACDQPGEFIDWLQSGLYSRALDLKQTRQVLEQILPLQEADGKELDRSLRVFRRQFMMRIVWRDFTRIASFEETARDMSHLAEVVIEAGIQVHYRLLQQRFGAPTGKSSGTQQPMVVLGMGKLGGYELNVSSDIDLIFAYPEVGETRGGRKSISNQEFFIKLGQKLIASLDSSTRDGFVFRVDMRLRPYGESGSLVLNFDAMEEYYQTQGRDWERYAMIKARVVSGESQPGASAAGKRLMALLQPFTYRRYVDFSAVESMRDMKAMIQREVLRRGLQGDVKLGAGGIREIEFVVQVFQMIRGGRDSRLQGRSVLKLLPLLDEEGLLPSGEAEALAEAYVYLRNVEHALQGYQDRQTQSLPGDSWEQQRLAWLMGAASWRDFEQQLQGIRDVVNRCFENVIAESKEPAREVSDYSDWVALWPSLNVPQGDIGEQDLVSLLSERGASQPQEMAEILIALRADRSLRAMQPIGIERLDKLMPRLLAKVCERGESPETLRRVLNLVESVARRTAYLLLLVENPDALNQLLTLCGASSWISEQLARYPSLLDELLDARRLYSPPDRERLQDELRQQMMRVNWDDVEAQMESLRYFRNSHALIVAASEVAEVLPLMKVSDYLSWLAEVILEHVLNLAWHQMTVRHGVPRAADDGTEAEFIVVGYGKLGGLELGHGSDLDLVFLYDAAAEGSSDGERPLDHRTWFTRLGQKMIHILNTQTLSGQLYEVDMRLRPSGNSGMLVSSLTAFSKYQHEQAWTWEHQALTRARVVAGGAGLARKFEALREEILCMERDPEGLRREVVEMREKMRQHLGSKGTDQQKARQFHLKQDSGGIVDIEFMVQYAVLAWAHDHSSLTRWTDNIRILDTLEAQGLMSAEQTNSLKEAYIAYRSVGHKLTLQRQPGIVDGGEFGAERAAVQAVWNELFKS